MEVIIIMVIILGYCLILNVGFDYILLGVAILLCLFAGFLTLGFLYCIIRLLFSKRKEAKFLRFEKMRSSKYQVACYLVDGEEYMCMFPREGIMKDKLYQKDKIYYVMLNKRMGKVFDRFAVTTCIFGLVFGVALSVGIVYCFVMY